MKPLVPFLALLFFTLLLHGQQHASSPRVGDASHLSDRYAPVCPSDVLLKNILQANPVLRLHHQAIDSLIHDQLDVRNSAISRNRNGSVHTNTIASIPVVVHIVHNNGPENISDATVTQGIADLNQAFANTGPYAQTNGVDIGIQFCLATQDPNGAFTTGITRDVSPLTDMTMETDDLPVKDLNRWDPQRYLNIWLVREITSLSMGSGVAGYAYFPSSHGNPEDGIMNEAGYFGSSADFSKVHIHEAGHYLGLYHTFEGGCINNDCLADGDRVCDTPPDNSTANVPCISAPNTCTTDTDDGSANNPFRPLSAGGLGDQPDLLSDHMDYGLLGCHTLFTPGQRDRMLAAVQGARSSLLASHGCWTLCTSPVTASFDTAYDTLSVGTTVTLANFSTGATTYEWLINGIPVSAAIDLNYTFTASGTFIISMIASNGDSSCTQSAGDTLHVFCGTNPTFGMSTSACIPRGTDVLFYTTTPGNISCQWLKDGQVVGTDTILAYTFSQTGGYQITLVSHNGICYDTSASVFIQAGRCQDQEAANWYFGNYAGISFNSGTATALTNGELWVFEGSVSMSDKSGNLLFYTDGDSVFNRNHVAMPNSIYLYSGGSESQAGLAVPWPGHPEKYIFFQTAVAEDTFAFPFRYSVIDMTLNGGMGDIFPYNTTLHHPVEEKVSGTMHCNDRAIWVMTHEWDTNNFLAYLVDSNGVNSTPVISSIGPVHTGFYSEPGRGHMKFSNDGKWLAISTFDYPMQLLSFDNATGLLSNPMSFPATQYNYGIEFSPDNKKLYHSEHINSADGHIVQYDLSSANATTILNSKTEVLLVAPGNHNCLQLAPDGKIYFSNGFTPHDSYVGVINFPNASGTACQAVSEGLYLNGKKSMSGLPNFMSTSFFTDDLSINGPDTVCPNATAVQYSIHANAWNLGSYSWSAAGNVSILAYTDSTVSLTFTGAGTDTLVIRKTTNCGILTDTLFILAAPAWPDLGEDLALCAGDTLVLALPENYAAYHWQDGNQNAEYPVLQPGDYWVDVSTANGCVLRDSIHVSLNTSQTQVDLGPDILICPGAVAVLNAGTGYTSYRWQDGSSNSQFTAWLAGTYWVTVSNAGDCSAFAVDSIHVIYDNALQISLGADTTICSGTTLTLSPGNGFASYLWSDQSTAASLTVSQSGTYFVEVVSAASCPAIDSIDVRFDTLQADLGIDSSVCQGGWIILSPGNSFSAYEWSDQSTQPSLTVTIPGEYWVEVVSPYHCVSIDSIHIGNKIVPSISLGADTSLCPGEQITLQASTGFSTYLWSNAETTASIAVTQEGWYSVLATTAENCSTGDSVHVTYYTLPLIELGNDTTICENEDLLLHAGNNFYVYNWSDNSHDSTLSVQNPGTYWVTATADYRCIAGDSIDVFTKECKGTTDYIHIFPNPNDGSFYVEVLNAKTIQDIGIDIYDALGQLIYDETMDVEQDLISKKFISVFLASGVYFVQVHGEGLHESVKLIRF